jgi:hypothetical protein
VFRTITKAETSNGDLLTEQNLPAVKAFAIESNRIRKIADFGPEEDVETEAAPFLDLADNKGAHEQDDTFMGYKTDLEGWTEGFIPGSEENRGKYHSPLTVVNSSNPLFPDYQPHNPNVFSFHDDLTYLKGDKRLTLKHAEVSYLVFGYYSDEKHDPFFVDINAKPETQAGKVAPAGLQIPKF